MDLRARAPFDDDLLLHQVREELPEGGLLRLQQEGRDCFGAALHALRPGEQVHPGIRLQTDQGLSESVEIKL